VPIPLEPGARTRLHLIVKIALMYHQRGLSQAQIAKDLKLSQARVSQLLKAAGEEGIVETTVHVPSGMFSDLEDALERRYGIGEIAVTDTGPARDDSKEALGASAAPFVHRALEGAKIIGVAAWSETLLATAEAMAPIPGTPGRYLVNVFGGFGPSVSQSYRRVMEQLARVAKAQPVFLLGPGIVASASVRNALKRDEQLREVSSFYDRLSVLLVGIGALNLRLLRDGGHVSEADQRELRAKGAVGDVALHFFDEQGRPVRSSLEERVLGISLEQLQAAPKVVAVAGGESKFEAIRAALRGRWVHSLITDLATAQRLQKDP
jgi:DNA-binding transcriptional regulator LsrR (DeoR family)